jgi:hypothetical protein
MKNLSYVKLAEMAAGEACPVREANFVLFSSSAVAVASYCGTPAAGFLLIAVNYKRIGERQFVPAALILGFAATWLEAVCVVFLPFAVWLPLCLGLLVGTRLFAAKVQGELVALHVSRGGRLGSRWLAFGAGIACLLAVLTGGLVLTYFERFSR